MDKGLTPWSSVAQPPPKENENVTPPQKEEVKSEEVPPPPPPARKSELLSALSEHDYLKIRILVTEKVKNGKCKGDFLLDVCQVLELYMRNPDEDKIAIDAMNWCCMAIGNSGNKDFIPLLKKVEKAGVHKRIQSYAAKAIRMIYEQTGLSLGSYEKNLLGRLKSGEWSVVRSAAKEIVRNSQYSPLLMGQMQSILEKYGKNPVEEKLTVDAVCWCLTVFGKAKNKKYLPFLKKLEKNKLPRKVKSYTSEAIADIEGGFHIPFLPKIGKSSQGTHPAAKTAKKVDADQD